MYEQKKEDLLTLPFETSVTENQQTITSVFIYSNVVISISTLLHEPDWRYIV